MGSSGKALGIVGLLLALGALGLGIYQIVATPSSEEPRIYIRSNAGQVDLNIAGWRSIPNIAVTYNTGAGDQVLLEFSCLVKLDIYTSITYIQICFVIDTVRLTTVSYIYLRGDDTFDSQYIYDSAIMRHYIQSSTAGEHTVSVDAYIDDSSTTSWVSFSVLTVEIY